MRQKLPITALWRCQAALAPASHVYLLPPFAFTATPPCESLVSLSDWGWRKFRTGNRRVEAIQLDNDREPFLLAHGGHKPCKVERQDAHSSRRPALWHLASAVSELMAAHEVAPLAAHNNLQPSPAVSRKLTAEG